MMLKMLPFKLLLVAVVLCFFEGDAKFGESGARRRRCLNGTPPRRLKKRDRRVLSPEAPGGGEAMCRGLYPRLSCCSRSEAQGLPHAEAKVLSVTNNTECAKLLEEIKCAHCSPHAQNLFHSPEKGETPEKELMLPYLCKDYCKEFYYTCRAHIPVQAGLAAKTETCYHGTGAVCQREETREWLIRESGKVEFAEGGIGREIQCEEQLAANTSGERRKHKHNCFCIQEVVSGLRQPIGAVHCGDGSHRLFILEKEGYVKIFTPEGDILKEPFLDIHKLVQSGIKITILFKISKQQGLIRDVFEQSSVSYFLTKSSDHLWKTNSEISTELLLVPKKPLSRKLLQLQLRDKAKWKTDFPCFWTGTNLLDMIRQGGDERGLLSLAFHPNYKKNGKLYVSYTTNQERWAIGPHDHILRVVEYTVSRKNPHQVDMRTARVFLEVAELHRKHLGGQLLFGPDGFLYIFLGDGMITLDDMEEMDGLSDFTGSVLRLDVNTDLCNVPYSIPRSNPHFNSTNQPPEIFAHGLHNPGRCAVDRHPTDVNINLTILCSDSNGKNRSSARILQIIKGKDYGEIYILSSSKSMTQPHSGKLYKIVDPKRIIETLRLEKTSKISKSNL
ncbi:hypothetical protein DUI87_08769 [Hirundo rustica rustica]|uniref:Glucose/Sorbosone dehydrogenase domain-containing protein n=1 Tax=Hirundo rustica rustica TaxID=333673 RepID=A0A3M0KM39_HIRRU|nr:hypothetical protein DUI87_08769 [Hirundo rustica rustica]